MEPGGGRWTFCGAYPGVYGALEEAGLPLPEIHAVSQNATYLMWLDISRYTDDSGAFQRFLRKETGLYVTPGTIYGGDGNRFLRLNVACPRSLLEDGLGRLKTGYELWRTERRGNL